MSQQAIIDFACYLQENNDALEKYRQIKLKSANDCAPVVEFASNCGFTFSAGQYREAMAQSARKMGSLSIDDLEQIAGGRLEMTIDQRKPDPEKSLYFLLTL